MRAAPVQPDVEERTEEGAEGVVRRPRLVLLAARADLDHVAALLLQLLREPRLADPGLADQLDQRAVARTRRSDRCGEHRPLAFPADERQGPSLLGRGRGLRGHPANVAGGDGLGDAFERERLQLDGLEGATGALEQVRRSEHLAGLRLAHQTRGESRSRTEDGVRLAELRADLAGEHAATTDPDPQPQRRLEVGDATSRAQDPLLILAFGLRRASDEDDLAAVAVDVTLEEGDPVLVRDLLGAADELVEDAFQPVGAFLGKQIIDPAEVDERDGGLPVLRLGLAVRKLAADRGRDAAVQVEAGGRRQWRDRAHGSRRRAQQASALLLVAEDPLRQTGGGLVADEDLAGLGARLHLNRPRDAGPGEQQLAVRLADEEEVEDVAVDADVHLQRHRPDRRPRPPQRPQGPAHAVGGIAGTGSVVLPGEEEEQGVATELEQSTPSRVGDVEQALEGPIHHLRDLLGAELALLGEPLGHCGEAGDVDEVERSLEFASSGVGLCAQPVHDDARHVGRQVDGGWGCLGKRSHVPWAPSRPGARRERIVARAKVLRARRALAPTSPA